LDDYSKVSKKNTKGISGKVRLLWEFGIAAAACSYLFMSDTMSPEVRLALQLPCVDFYDGAVQMPLWLYVGFAAVVVVGTANAVNLTDG
ncbi:phospho-N-acetylmuramoyl-pentapeptide-transferase, partial [Enterococcus hirae]